MALEGTLSDFSLPDIFQLISLQRKSGVLTLKGKDDIVTVFFKEGKILAADSQQERIEHRLGYYLVRAKLLTDEQLKKALDIQKETLQRLGNILLSYNFIAKEDLQKTLQLVITQKIYKLFRWRDGEYHFDTDAPVEFKDDYFTPIPAQGILMEAVRMIDEWPLLEKKVPNLNIIYRKTGKSLEKDKAEGKSLTADDLFGDNDDFSDLFNATKNMRTEDQNLEEEEERVFRFIDGKRTIKDIVLDAQMTDFDACHAIASILDKRLIEPLEQFRIDHKAQWADSRKKVDVKFPLGKIFLPVMITAMLISIVMMNFIPLNILVPYQQNKNKICNSYNESLSLNQIKRIASAVEIYYFCTRRYPSNLKDLVDEGLIRENTLRDPWGNPYSFKISENAYMLTGRDHKGSDTIIYQNTLIN
jgi:competence protein ComGC